MKINRRICIKAYCVLFCFSLLLPAVSKGNSSPAVHEANELDDPLESSSSLYTIGRNVQVSVANLHTVHYEVSGCANPDDPNLMLVGSMAFKEDGTVSTYLYRSTDRGQTWSLTLAPVQDIVTDGDPTCVFGPNGSAYYATFSMLTDGYRHILLYRSSDNGKTWLRSEPQVGIDRPFLAIDRSGGPYNGTIYCTGQGSVRSLKSKGESGPRAINQHMTAAAVMVSRDGGRSLEGPFLRAAFGDEYFFAGANVVLSDGMLVFSSSVKNDRLAPDRIGSMSAAKLQSIRINAGAHHLEPATTIADWSRSWQNGAHIPMMAVDPGTPSFKDRIYVVRIDDQLARSRVLLNYSSDQGRTWSRSRTVDDDVSPTDVQQNPNATNPGIAVNRNGVVAIGWADRRDSSDNLGWWYRMSLSFDGGETFLPSFKVASARHSLESGNTPLFAFADRSKANDPQKVSIAIHPWHYGGGHTVDMLVDSQGVFYPVWVDNRTGTPQVWITAVSVRGSAMSGGSDELAKLSDVTSEVSLEYMTQRYDSSKQTIHIAVRLKNKSSNVVYGPAKLRVISITSDLGNVEAIDPAVHQPTGGVVWELSQSFKNGRLRPGEVSEPTELVFRLNHAKRAGQADYKFALCNLEARIIAISN